MRASLSLAAWTRRWVAADAALFRVSYISLYTASSDDLASAIDRNLS